ncbi:MAG: hypothetical protein AB9872_06840 [Solidesulfovibrio sp.]
MTVGAAHKPYGVWPRSEVFGKESVGAVRWAPEGVAQKNWPEAATAIGRVEAALAALTQFVGG